MDLQLTINSAEAATEMWCAHFDHYKKKMVKVCKFGQLTLLMFVEPRSWNENPGHAG